MHSIMLFSLVIDQSSYKYTYICLLPLFATI